MSESNKSIELKEDFMANNFVIQLRRATTLSQRKSLKEFKLKEIEEDKELEGGVSIFQIPMPKYTPEMRKWAFLLLFWINMSSNLDHGALPSASPNIKKTLKINETELGTLLSLVFLGLFLGSIVSVGLFSRFRFKNILVVSYLGNAIGLAIFAFSKNYSLQCFSRFFSGFCQIMQSIYFPIFVNTLYTEEEQVQMLAFVFLSPPLGVIFGYVLAAVMINYTSWEVAFMVIAGIDFVNCILMLCFSAQYINTTDIVKQLKKVDEDKLNENYGLKSEFQSLNEVSNVSSQKQSTSKVLCKLIKNGSFILTALSLTCLFYIVTGIQNWMTIYMVDGLGIDKNQVHTGFAVVCISSPTLGAVMSGPLSKKFIGTNPRNVVPFLLVVTFLATASASPLPFISDFWVTLISLWGYLFFGGILVPVMTTYMLNSIEDEAERAIGNSFANVLYYGLGYLPSPFMWGFVQDQTGGTHSKWGLVANLGMNLPPIIMLLLAFRFRPKGSDISITNNDEPDFLRSTSSIHEPMLTGRSSSFIQQTGVFGFVRSGTGRSFVAVNTERKPFSSRAQVRERFLTMIQSQSANSFTEQLENDDCDDSLPEMVKDQTIQQQ